MHERTHAHAAADTLRYQGLIGAGGPLVGKKSSKCCYFSPLAAGRFPNEMSTTGHQAPFKNAHASVALQPTSFATR